jgi:hypothetical protein
MKELEEAMEKKYHCRIVYEDVYGLAGHLEISEEKYQNWFILTFGDINTNE